MKCEKPVNMDGWMDKLIGRKWGDGEGEREWRGQQEKGVKERGDEG